AAECPDGVAIDLFVRLVGSTAQLPSAVNVVHGVQRAGGQPMRSHQPANTAGECVPRHTHAAGGATESEKPVRLGHALHLVPGSTGPYVGHLLLGIERDRIQQAGIDQERAVGQFAPGAVACSLHDDPQTVAVGRGDCCGDLRPGPRAHHRSGMLRKTGVVRRGGPVVSRASWSQYLHIAGLTLQLPEQVRVRCRLLVHGVPHLVSADCVVLVRLPDNPRPQYPHNRTISSVYSRWADRFTTPCPAARAARLRDSYVPAHTRLVRTGPELRYTGLPLAAIARRTLGGRSSVGRAPRCGRGCRG